MSRIGQSVDHDRQGVAGSNGHPELLRADASRPPPNKTRGGTGNQGAVSRPYVAYILSETLLHLQLMHTCI